MKKIDAHQHFWKFDPVRDSWINDEMKAIQRDFLPSDLQPVLEASGIDGCVTIQSDQSEEENDFQLQNADQNGFIKGVVGWVDLRAENIAERLQHYSQFKKMKGFRHVLQGEPQRDLMLHPTFKRGIGLLNKYGFTYDVLIFADQLPFTKELVAAYPDQKFVIDHIAKPDIKGGKIDDWKRNIEALGQYQNLFCKVSGMVTEAHWRNWRREEFTPYLDVVVNTFGTTRIMFGSDWPVCIVSATYREMLSMVKDYFSSFSENEQELFFGGNAAKFYNLI